MGRSKPLTPREILLKREQLAGSLAGKDIEAQSERFKAQQRQKWETDRTDFERTKEKRVAIDSFVNRGHTRMETAKGSFGLMATITKVAIIPIAIGLLILGPGVGAFVGILNAMTWWAWALLIVGLIWFWRMR